MVDSEIYLRRYAITVLSCLCFLLELFSSANAIPYRYSVEGGIFFDYYNDDNDYRHTVMDINGYAYLNQTDHLFSPYELGPGYPYGDYPWLAYDISYVIIIQVSGLESSYYYKGSGGVDFLAADVEIYLGGGRFDTEFPEPGTWQQENPLTPPVSFHGDTYEAFMPWDWINVIDSNLLSSADWYGGSIHFNSAPVPEPSTIMLLVTGLIGLARFKKKLRM